MAVTYLFVAFGSVQKQAWLTVWIDMSFDINDLVQTAVLCMTFILAQGDSCGWDVMLMP